MARMKVYHNGEWIYADNVNGSVILIGEESEIAEQLAAAPVGAFWIDTADDTIDERLADADTKAY